MWPLRMRLYSRILLNGTSTKANEEKGHGYQKENGLPEVNNSDQEDRVRARRGMIRACPISRVGRKDPLREAACCGQQAYSTQDLQIDNGLRGCVLCMAISVSAWCASVPVFVVILVAALSYSWLAEVGCFL